MAYLLLALGSIFIGAVLHKQLIMLAQGALKLALIAWIVRSLFAFDPKIFAFVNISGFVTGALVGFLLIGVLLSRVIYRQLVRTDEKLEIAKARSHAKARLELQ